MEQTKSAGFIGGDHPSFVRVYDSVTSRHIVAKNVNSKIHIFCGEERKLIVSCPNKPTAFELQRSQDGQWQIWMATCVGTMYRKLLKLVPIASTEPMEGDDGSESNHSIFDDLLNNSEPAFPDFEFDLPIRNGSDDVSVTEVGEEDKLFSCPGEVVSISCSDDFLAVVCMDRDGPTAMVYPVFNLVSQKCNTPAQKLLLPFSRFSQVKKLKDVQFKLNVLSDDNANSVSSSQINVPSHLLSSLFGWESSVRTLPVLLCSLPGGFVYFQPVDLTTSKPASSWQLLCSVDSPVVEIFAVKLDRTLSEKESIAAELQRSLGLSLLAPSHSKLDAVVVIGASGKCCLMTAMPTFDSRTDDYFGVVSVFTAPSRVGCVCHRDQTLFVSSGQCIHKCSLTLHRDEASQGKKRYRVDVTSEQLCRAAVSSMWLSGGGATLLCETDNGDLVEFDTSAPAPDYNTTTRLLQPSLKELLLGVNTNQAKVNKLKSQQHELNASLQQVNIASHILYFHHRHASAAASHDAAPISCNVTVQSEVGYHTVMYHLVIKVSNSCGAPLTGDWNLVSTIHRFGNKLSTSTKQILPQDPPSSHTLKLSHGLGTGQSVLFRIPITYSPSCCGLSVSVSLMLHTSDLLQGEVKSDEVSSSCLVIPLAAAVVDLFYFLHLRKPGNILPQTVDPVCLVEKRMAALGGSSQDERDVGKKQRGQSYSVAEEITVTEAQLPTAVDVLHHLLQDSQTDLGGSGHSTCVLQAPCGSTLSISVELTADQRSPGKADGDGKSYLIEIKSSNVSLLARARLSLRRRLQFTQNICRKQRDATVEEFQKVTSKTEALQKQLQGIYTNSSSRERSISAEAVTQLHALYEAMRSGSF